MNAIFTGTSPAGVAWYVHTDGRSDQEISESVKIQKDRLASLWARHLDAVVTVRLSDRALDAVSDYYQSGGYEEGKTYVRAPRHVLRDIADVLESWQDDLGDPDRYAHHEHPGREQMAARAAVRSLTAAASKLRSA